MEQAWGVGWGCSQTPFSKNTTSLLIMSKSRAKPCWRLITLWHLLRDFGGFFHLLSNVVYLCLRDPHPCRQRHSQKYDFFFWNVLEIIICVSFGTHVIQRNKKLNTNFFFCKNLCLPLEAGLRLEMEIDWQAQQPIRTQNNVLLKKKTCRIAFEKILRNNKTTKLKLQYNKGTYWIP